MRLRFPLPHSACLVSGTLIGVTVGDKVLPWVEVMYGDPMADIFFGLLGGFFALMAFETVVMFLRPD